MADPDQMTADFSTIEPPERSTLSALLLTIATEGQGERLSIGDLLLALQHRAIAALLFLFAVPNAVPVPPGVSAILGAPLLFLAAQLMLGQRPWLPKIITDRSISRVDFQTVVTKTAPWLAKAERLMKPRLEVFARPPLVNLVGAVCLVLAIILFLPIPLGNMLPAFTICVLALGIIQRDGLWISIGLVVSVVAVVIVWGVLWAMLAATLFLAGQMFGF